MNNLMLKIYKNKPQLLLVGGVAGFISTAALTGVATYKAMKIIEADQKEKMTKKEKLHLFGKVAVKFIPPIALGTASTLAIFAGKGEYSKRLAAASSTLAATVKAYDEYRERVVEKYGNDAESEIYLKETKDATDDGSVGTTKIEPLTPHIRIFDETNPFFTGSIEHDLATIRLQIESLKQRLESKGHLFLNEAFEALGFADTPSGSVNGWLKINPQAPTRTNFIEFYYKSGEDKSAITIEFKPDGLMYDLI